MTYERATVNDLLESTEEKTIDLHSVKKSVTVRKIDYGRMASIGRKAGDDPYQWAKYIILACIVEPRLTEKDVDGMKVSAVMELARELGDYVGVSATAMERAKKSLLQMKGTASGP